jgi:predicted dehydrogenase
MKAIIVGLGIGQLYRSILSDWEVTTVDADLAKQATYTDVNKVTGEFDLAVICTPNFTHEAIARQLAPLCKIVLIEKPGLESADAWQQLVSDFPDTRFMMIKNNMWRDNIGELRALANTSAKTTINWINNDRVPRPGSWFTDKKSSWGGVSKDLMPHLASLYIAMYPNTFDKGVPVYRVMKQHWQLDDLSGSDYGEVNKTGVYDVDDYAEMQINMYQKKISFTADWRGLSGDDIAIHFDNFHSVELGLCPESAYLNMVNDAVANVDNPEFWQQQLKYDLFIHSTLKFYAS